jgi:hypothetical protein
LVSPKRRVKESVYPNPLLVLTNSPSRSEPAKARLASLAVDHRNYTRNARAWGPVRFALRLNLSIGRFSNLWVSGFHIHFRSSVFST